MIFNNEETERISSDVIVTKLVSLSSSEVTAVVITSLELKLVSLSSSEVPAVVTLLGFSCFGFLDLL